MSLTVKETKGGGSAPIEPGAYPARCVGVVDLGIQHNDFNNKDQEKVRHPQKGRSSAPST